MTCPTQREEADHDQAELNTPQDVLTCKSKSLATSDLNPNGLPQCIPMTPAEIGLVGSIYTLGGFVGALLSGPVGYKQGRLRTMQFTTSFFVAGPVLEAAAVNITLLAVGRFISGLGAGAAMVVAPIYIAEISPPADRGLFGAFTQIMVNVGILVAQLLGFFLSHGQYWRLILAAGGAIGTSQILLLAFGGCESPKWSATQGLSGKAKHDLRRIRGDKFDVDEEIKSWNVDAGVMDVDTEDEGQTLLPADVHQPSDSSNLEAPSVLKRQAAAKAPNMWQVLRQPQTRPAVIAVIAVMLAQQLTGINSVIMYGVHLLASVLESNSATLNVAVSALNILMTAFAAPLIDRLGRKTCLLTSIGGMGISSLLLAIGIDSKIPVLSAISVAFFVGSFGLGLGPVPFLLSSELVDPEAVGSTQSWALGANWAATFVVAQFFPVVNEWLGGGKVYYVFMSISVLFFIFVGWWVPETRGKANAEEVWGRSRRDD